MVSHAEIEIRDIPASTPVKGEPPKEEEEKE